MFFQGSYFFFKVCHGTVHTHHPGIQITDKKQNKNDRQGGHTKTQKGYRLQHIHFFLFRFDRLNGLIEFGCFAHVIL